MDTLGIDKDLIPQINEARFSKYENIRHLEDEDFGIKLGTVTMIDWTQVYAIAQDGDKTSLVIIGAGGWEVGMKYMDTLAEWSKFHNDYDEYLEFRVTENDITGKDEVSERKIAIDTTKIAAVMQGHRTVNGEKYLLYCLALENGIEIYIKKYGNEKRWWE